MRPSLKSTVTACLWIGAAAMLGFGLFRSRAAPVPRLSDLPVVEDAEQVAAVGLRVGAPDAPLRIVEFMDFQCPYCKLGADRLEQIQRRHPGGVTVVMRHFPVGSAHPHAFNAALAAECAAEQGRFEDVRSVLLQYQDSIGVAGWGWIASRGGVPDVAAFEGCIRDQRHSEAIHRDVDVATRIGVRATPTYVFAGRLLTGADAIDHIEEALAGSR